MLKRQTGARDLVDWAIANVLWRGIYELFVPLISPLSEHLLRARDAVNLDFSGCR